MSRMIFWIVLFGAAWWFWRRAKASILRHMMDAQARAGGGGTMSGAGAGTARQRAPELAEPMARCACCGAYSPRGDTIEMYQHRFCNAEHARRYAEGERPST